MLLAAGFFVGKWHNCTNEGASIEIGVLMGHQQTKKLLGKFAPLTVEVMNQ